MPEANQIASAKQRDLVVTEEDLIRAPEGNKTLEALRHNIRVGVQYLEAWISGNGCVPLYFLMEDAATAEISRTQIWQWLKHGVSLQDGQGGEVELTAALIEEALGEELAVIARTRSAPSASPPAASRRPESSSSRSPPSDPLIEFLTLPAYARIVEEKARAGL